MVKVNARNNETFESLIKRFNTAVTQDGILKELKERSVYEKPSSKKRRIRAERRKEMKNSV